MRDGRRPPILIPVLGALFLVFLAGSAVTEFRLAPYRALLEPAYESLRAQLSGARLRSGRPSQMEGELHWRMARTEATGVTRSVPDSLWGDFTLYTSTHASAAFLVDRAGEVVHEWRLPFHEAFPDAEHVESPVDEEQIFLSSALVYPNGDLVTRYGARGDTPYGYGLVKVDRDSNPLWTFSGTSHHDVQMEAEGTLVTLTHRFRRPAQDPLLAELPFPDRILVDEIVRLSPEGEELQRVDLVEAFASSEFRWVLESTFLTDNDLPAWDVLHANAVRPVPEGWARHHDFAEAGWWLVSLRSPSLLALVDPESEEVRWFARGFWRFQHDPHPLDDGGLLLFDNQGYAGEGGPSRLLELDAATGAVEWSYEGSEEDYFYSEYSSHARPLPNGNVLVTESNAGRIFEVTRGGRVVWEFWNPARAVDEGAEFVASVNDARRYTAAQLPFLER